MMVLDDVSRSLVNLLFGLVGVWMAHSFYRSPRGGVRVVGVWVLGFAYCAAMALTVNRLGWFSWETHEHLSNAIGFGAIFVYIYLFPQIPIAQRIYTYFFIDNSLYILVLVARLAALRLTGLAVLSHSMLFTLLFLLITSLFLWVFVYKLKQPILAGLSAFRGQLPVLTVYACVSYMTMIALVDPWAPMQPQGWGRDLALLLLCATVMCGYALAFYLMHSARREQQAQLETHELTGLLTVSRRYYDALVDSIEQERALRHDFIHHLRAMEAMHKDGRLEYLGEYLVELLGRTEAKKSSNWCACYVANVLLNHYATQAQDAGITCTFDAAIPEWDAQESPKLCVILGNLLQNALEACCLLPDGTERSIALLARVVNGNLTIEVNNSFDGMVQTADGDITSRKAEGGHGLGLASVRNVIAQEGGYFQTLYSGQIFTAHAVLPIPKSMQTCQIP